MIGANALVEMLKQYQVEYIFGVPGDTSIAFYEALYDAGFKEAFASDVPVFLDIKSEPEAEHLPPVYSWHKAANLAGKVG